MVTWIPLFKTLHIFGFVAWFAGLFYLVRMFVYHREAFDKPMPDRQILTRQYQIMEWRVYKIILTPAMNLTWTFGILMIISYGWEWFRLSTWLHVKILLLILLTVYQIYMKKLIRRLQNGELPFSSQQFRLLNEVPTLFLLAIALLAVYKNSLNALYAILGIIIFAVLLMLGIKWYKRVRTRSER